MKFSPPQIEALAVARDHADAYAIRTPTGIRRGTRYERAARSRVVAALQRLGLLDGSQITDDGLKALRVAEARTGRKPAGDVASAHAAFQKAPGRETFEALRVALDVYRLAADNGDAPW